MKRSGLLASLCMIGASMLGSDAVADEFVQGVPTLVQKSDYGAVHGLYVHFQTPIPLSGCNSGDGVFIKDDNPSAKQAVSFALAAQASGKKFRCYVVTGVCSQRDGGAVTFPVCSYYPGVNN